MSFRFQRIKKKRPKKTLRPLKKNKYDINYGELDSLTPNSPNYTRRSSEVHSQSSTPLINHTTGSRVIDLANVHIRPLPSSPNGGGIRNSNRRMRQRRQTRRPR